MSQPYQKIKPEDLAYINSVNEAVLEKTPRGASLLLWLMLLFITAAIAWAYWAELDELVRGEGEIIPSSQLQIVQNLEGGIVSEILVHEGDLVEAGQVLLRIEDKRFSSSVKENEVRAFELEAKLARLAAEANGTEFAEPQAFPDLYRDFIAQELNLFNSRQDELDANQAVLSQQLSQRQQELIEAKSRLEQVRRSYNLLLRELNITEPLLKEGVISEVEFLRLQRQVNDLRGERSSIELSLPRIESAIEEIAGKQGEMELQFRNIARAEYNELLAERTRLSEALSGMQDRISRTEVRAPVKGTVKELLINTIDGVVRPGDQLLSIVPWEDKLLIEARIKPADIGRLKVGQTATVKVSAYDFAIYGGMDAYLRFISPSTFLTEQNEAYYLVRLETVSPYLDAENETMPLIAGMTVSVDVLTGKKTLLNYLLKPIIRAKANALTEP